MTALLILTLVAFLLYARHAQRCMDRAYLQGYQLGRQNLINEQKERYRQWCQTEQQYGKQPRA